MKNVDPQTVEDFGKEWKSFDQSPLSKSEIQRSFGEYFNIFPWSALNSQSVGADFGCGSGRWASQVIERVGKLWAVDASPVALGVAKNNLKHSSKVEFVCASVEEVPIGSESLDFAYSLGVLHHIPKIHTALKEIARTLKPGAPFLIYLYYNFENSPWWFRWLWLGSDFCRKVIARQPFFIKRILCEVIATTTYWPLARGAALAKRLTKKELPKWPLSYYSEKSFYAMRTDALDRFGTRLENRFSRKKIQELLLDAGFCNVTFSDSQPYWTALCFRRGSG